MTNIYHLKIKQKFMRSTVYVVYLHIWSKYYISGHFGCVYRGYLEIPNVKGSTLVAVKTLHRKFILILTIIDDLYITLSPMKKIGFFYSVTVLNWTIANSDSINIS